MNRFPALLVYFSSVLIAGTLMACSEQVNRRPVGQPAATGTTAAPLTAPQGPYPRGTTAATATPSSAGPELTVVSPPRGAQITASSVVVRATATDQDGVAEVRIAGAPATQVGPDEWVANVQLPAGVSFIPLSASDALGNQTSSYVSVCQGTFAADDTPVPASLGAALTDGALQRLEQIAQDKLGQLDIAAAITSLNPVYDTSLLKVSVTRLTYGPPVVNVDGQTSGLLVELAIPTLQVDIEAKAGVRVRASLRADPAIARVALTISQQAFTGTKPGKQALGLEVDRVQIVLDNFRIVTGSSFVNTVLSPFQGTLRSVTQNALGKAIEGLAGKLLNGQLTAVDQPLVLDLPRLDGSRAKIGVQVQVEHARGFTGGGLDLLAGGTISGVFSATFVPPTRQSLVHGQPIVTPAAGPEPFAVTISADLINRLLHHVWLAGILNTTIDGTQPPAPTSTIQLNANILYPFFPPVRELAPDPNTPLRIEVSLHSAPVLVLGGVTAPAEVQAGEVQLRLMLDYMDGAPPLELFTARLGAILEVDLDVVGGNKIKAQKFRFREAHLEVVQEVAADFDDQGLEDFFNQALPWLIDKYATGMLPEIPIPALPLGINLQNPTLEARPGFLTVRTGI